MAWAIFHRTFNFDFRPAMAACKEFRPAAVPQEAPERVIAAAVKAGAADRVKSPTANQKRALKRAERAE